jgi:hypothetical protein
MADGATTPRVATGMATAVECRDQLGQFFAPPAIAGLRGGAVRRREGGCVPRAEGGRGDRCAV